MGAFRLWFGRAPLRKKMPTTKKYGALSVETVDLWANEGPLKRDVLVIPGGGFGNGDGGAASKAGDMAKKLSKNGFRAWSMSYPGVPIRYWPAIMDSIRACRAFIDTQVTSPGVVSYGFSAGGNLGQWLANEGRVLKHVNVSGPADLVMMQNNPKVLAYCPTGDYGSPSPALHVLPTCAPTMLWYGKADTDVPPQQGIAMEAALAAAGVPVIRREYNGGHVFEGTSDAEMKLIRPEQFAWLAA